MASLQNRYSESGGKTVYDAGIERLNLGRSIYVIKFRLRSLSCFRGGDLDTSREVSWTPQILGNSQEF